MSSRDPKIQLKNEFEANFSSGRSDIKVMILTLDNRRFNYNTRLIWRFAIYCQTLGRFY